MTSQLVLQGKCVGEWSERRTSLSSNRGFDFRYVALTTTVEPAITKRHGTEKNVRYSEDPVITKLGTFRSEGEDDYEYEVSVLSTRTPTLMRMLSAENSYS